MSILSALKGIPETDVEKVSTKTKQILNELKNVMDSTNNFAMYRKKVSIVTPPSVPFLCTITAFID
jgi:hypothetical protein